jgi:hypothetical protein
VISPKQKYIFGIFDFTDKKKSDDFNAKEPPINIIAKKKVLFLVGGATFVENINKVKKLSMNIANNNNRGDDLKHVGLIL